MKERGEMKKGFTLIEILISALVLAILGGGLFSTIVYGMKVYRRIHRQEIAINALKTKISEIEGKSYNDVINENFNIEDSAGNPIPGFTGEISFSEVEPSQMKEVTITVKYTDPSGSELPISGDKCPGVQNCTQMQVVVSKLNKG